MGRPLLLNSTRASWSRLYFLNFPPLIRSMKSHCPFYPPCSLLQRNKKKSNFPLFLKGKKSCLFLQYVFSVSPDINIKEFYQASARQWNTTSFLTPTSDSQCLPETFHPPSLNHSSVLTGCGLAFCFKHGWLYCCITQQEPYEEKLQRLHILMWS